MKVVFLFQRDDTKPPEEQEYGLEQVPRQGDAVSLPHDAEYSYMVRDVWWEVSDRGDLVAHVNLRGAPKIAEASEETE